MCESRSRDEGLRPQVELIGCVRSTLPRTRTRARARTHTPTPPPAPPPHRVYVLSGKKKNQHPRPLSSLFRRELIVLGREICCSSSSSHTQLKANPHPPRCALHHTRGAFRSCRRVPGESAVGHRGAVFRMERVHDCGDAHQRRGEERWESILCAFLFFCFFSLPLHSSRATMNVPRGGGVKGDSFSRHVCVLG